MSLTPHLWEDVTAQTYAQADVLYTTYASVPADSYYSFLHPVAQDVTFVSTSDVRHFEDFDNITIIEDHEGFVEEFSVVFNESLTAPGFDITIIGLLSGSAQFDVVNVFRRDPSGRYPDEQVRGLANITVAENEMRVTDYEAPLNTLLEYYINLTQGTDEFALGPILPTPDPFIPTLSSAYAGGTAFFKPIDTPELSRAVMVDDFSSWNAPANILAEHHVLGRSNKVLIADVRGGREGSISGHSILTYGQIYEEIEAILAPGVTLLIQNHNRDASAFPDMYVQVQDVTFTRGTKMVWHGELDNPPKREMIVSFEFSYVQVDRPDPTGVNILSSTWQLVHNTFNTWKRVQLLRKKWINLFQQPNGPD